MMVRALGVLLAVAALLLPPAALAAPLPDATGPTGAACLAAAPPCGYITPIIDLQFPDKPKCPGAPGSVDLEKCGDLPAVGASVTYEGKVRWYWKLSEDLTYPPDPSQPIVLSFATTTSNPKYLSFKVEPSEFTIDATTLFDPNNMEVDQSNPSSPVVYFSFDPSITLTITRTGDATDAKDLQRLQDRDGLQTLYLKAKSTSSGQYFKESFGVEEFRFDGRPALPQDSPLRDGASASKASPAPAFVLALAALGVAALARRRAA